MPEFHIPRDFARFANQVERRFSVLLQKRVLTGIEILQLRNWRNNFESDEERYLAAHLLDSLVFRTEKMLASSSNHVLQMMLPNILMRCGRLHSPDLHDFLNKMTQGTAETGMRFVPVDGLFATKPKSGGELVRLFERATGVRDNLLVRPENIHKLGAAVKTLVFLDDCLGTGTQFKKFSDFYKLPQYAPARTLIYIPFVAHREGIEKLRQTCQSVLVCPVEVLGPNADFFYEDPDRAGIWNRDKYNTVEAVRKFYGETLEKRQVSLKEGAFCLNLSLGFNISTPNNTLKAFFSQEGSWERLLVR